METKVCGECGIEKDLEEFYAHPGTRDGRFKNCATCFRAYRKTLYAKPGDTATETVYRQISSRERRAPYLRGSSRWDVVR